MIYSRPGCHLCHEAESIIRGAPCLADIEIEVINIDKDPDLQAQYMEEVPVVLINGIKAFKHRVSAKEFCRKVRRLRGDVVKTVLRNFA